ncbi:shikimate dehydrogenase [Tanticharoenia sakaeratensis]|uniref:Shikimate dehydrogenase (NADP(+)) n=1 Tax=Tanticharoenia sakaeratensis NBRC 103193 TaxID=1231623 RepID=A0A0D6MMD8_9PROT|nr:shikimate dehydrogenase [Tanticharoenia sakaeratensis]GAN54827.1 shikimate 5-dehydrogenase [Tanticharoenia sakaeratensis NBRC 103193]GBQ21437.1 shikimate 5-dehydrogenase [Tanticharoenia sakaeratensis NBRC 103193]
MTKRNFNAILTGSFSTPSGGNPTVAMMEAAYQEAGMNARFINCDVKPDGLADAVRGARAMGWIGFNCSLPHKVAVIELLDELADSAAIIGAVNCVQIKDGRFIGNNTDGKGFLASLRTVTDPKGKRAVLFGAGGAARAIAVELALAGAEHVTIVNRNHGKANAIARLVTENSDASASAIRWEGDAAVPEGADIAINATSVGLGDAEAMPAIDPASLHDGLVVADVIPNPPQTRLLRMARERGCTTLDGLGMLVNQGIVGAQILFGRTLDEKVMHKTLADIFGV